MNSCLKVLIGSIVIILANVRFVFYGFKGRHRLYEEWHKANVPFTPGSEKYNQYMEQVQLNLVVLKSGDSMCVYYLCFSAVRH